MSAEQPQAPTPMLEEIRCSFCHKPGRSGRIVCGPNGVAICDECVALCREIIAEQTTPTPDLPPPAE